VIPPTGALDDDGDESGEGEGEEEDVTEVIMPLEVDVESVLVGAGSDDAALVDDISTVVSSVDEGAAASLVSVEDACASACVELSRFEEEVDVGGGPLISYDPMANTSESQ